MASSECACVKWHAPKPTRYFETKDGEKICLVTGQAALDLLERYQRKGRITKVAGRGFTAFQRELANKLWSNGGTLTLLDLEAPAEAEAEESEENTETTEE